MKKLILTILASLTFSACALAAPIKTDFVFIIDATGSMAGEIAGVRNGLSSFVTGLNAASVDARFSIILFGGAPELVLDFTSDQTATQTAFNNITIGSNPGFQNNHNLNPEAGLEAIRIALGEANDNTLRRDNVGGVGGLSYRNDARKNLILVTDEDSDLPFYSTNRQVGQTGSEPPSSLNAAWQAEVDATAAALIQQNAFINMLINSSDTPARSQYGDYVYDVSDPDFLNFDPAATLANLQGNALTQNSLEAQVLQAGLIARSFNVAGANDPNFVDNFFAAKIEETVENPVEVPEPATVALFGAGLLGLGLRRRRKVA